jgi:hypothetical protein
MIFKKEMGKGGIYFLKITSNILDFFLSFTDILDRRKHTLKINCTNLAKNHRLRSTIYREKDIN